MTPLTFDQLNSTTSVRNAVHRHGSSYRGFIQSDKGPNGSIPFESGLARDAVRLFDLAPEITLIVAEPTTIQLDHNARLTTYTPDYLLYLRDGGRAFVEVKPEREASSPHHQERYTQIASLIEAAGCMFAVLTERVLRATVLQQNMALLEQHKHRPIPPAILRKLQQFLREARQLKALVENIGCRDTVLAAIAQGHVRTDIRHSTLTDATLLRSI